MNDFVLLEIFSYLSISDLYSVARCSRGFKKMAVDAFEREFKGDYRSIGNQKNKCPWQSVDKLRIFGKSIRKFEAENFPLSLCASTKFWQRLDVAKLNMISIPWEAMLLYVSGRQCGQYGNLEELRSLTVLKADFSICNLHIREICPKLTVLDMGYLELRNNSKAVSTQYGELHAGCYLKLMTRLGLHKTVEVLSFSLDSDDHDFSYVTYLSKFKMLKSIVIDIDGTGGIHSLAIALGQMPLIEEVHIIAYDRRPQEEWANILNSIAAWISKDVKKFIFDGPFLRQPIWNEFVGEMPITCRCVIDDDLLV